jgi:hypothetical protein
VCQCFLKGYQDPTRESKSSSKPSLDNDKSPAKKKQKSQPDSTDESTTPERYPLTMLRDIVIKIRSSTDLLQKYSNYAISVGLQVERPPLDVCTRWNSTYFMLTHGLEYKKAIGLLVRAQEWKQLEMDEEDWKHLETLQSDSEMQSLTIQSFYCLLPHVPKFLEDKST